MRIGPLDIQWSRPKPLAGSGASLSSPHVTAQAAPIPPQGDDLQYAEMIQRTGAAYIYALIDPRTNAVRYVGKTNNLVGRARGHFKDKGPTYKAKWIRELKAAGYRPEIEVIEIINTGNPTDWETAERQWIANFKLMGYKLTNLTEGGDSGWTLNADARARISAAQKGKAKPASVRAAVALANRNRTPEQRAKSSALKRNPSPEVREKYRNAALNRGPEAAAKISATVKKHWENGVYGPHSKESYERMAAKMRGQKRTAEQRARMSKAAGIRNTNPEWQKQHSEALKGRKLSAESILKREATRRANRLAKKGQAA